MLRFLDKLTASLIVILASGLLGSTRLGSGSAQIPPQTPPANERTLLLTIDGATLYQMYCATCHGKNATGGGPTASALRKRVPDLTRIADRRGGAFPLDDVQLIISGEVVPSPAHGSREMPIWGPIFSQIEWDQDLGRVRIYNLARYLATLQKK